MRNLTVACLGPWGYHRHWPKDTVTQTGINRSSSSAVIYNWNRRGIIWTVLGKCLNCILFWYVLLGVLVNPNFIVILNEDERYWLWYKYSIINHVMLFILKQLVFLGWASTAQAVNADSNSDLRSEIGNQLAIKSRDMGLRLPIYDSIYQLHILFVKAWWLYSLVLGESEP